MYNKLGYIVTQNIAIPNHSLLWYTSLLNREGHIPMRVIINKLWQFKLPLMLVAIILLGYMVGPFLPLAVKQFLLFISQAFIESLLFVLPVIVFSLILTSIVHLKGGVLRLLLILIPLICISNFVAMWVSYGVGNFLVQNANLASLATSPDVQVLTPTWAFKLPRWLPISYSLLIAVVFGLISNAFFPERGQRIAAFMQHITVFILNKIVMPLLPLMILGMVIQMQYDGILEDLVHNYAYIFACVGALQVVYVLFCYMLVNKFNPIWIENVKNMLPPFITGFSTMSSAVTMPLTLIATRKNVHDPDIVNFVIPGTVNFHLMGDCLAMPIFALGVMVSFGYPLPGVAEYFTFTLFYVIARFGGAGIPGGGALILMPLLERHFGFTGSMLALIPTLNLAFDSMITGMNIMGNGAFAILFNKIFHWTKGTTPATAPETPVPQTQQASSETAAN